MCVDRMLVSQEPALNDSRSLTHSSVWYLDPITVTAAVSFMSATIRCLHSHDQIAYVTLSVAHASWKQTLVSYRVVNQHDATSITILLLTLCASSSTSHSLQTRNIHHQPSVWLDQSTKHMDTQCLVDHLSQLLDLSDCQTHVRIHHALVDVFCLGCVLMWLIVEWSSTHYRTRLAVDHSTMTNKDVS